MVNSVFSVGDRVARANDGAVGVVEEIGPIGGIFVRWDSSGMMSVVVQLNSAASDEQRSRARRREAPRLRAVVIGARRP